MKRKRWISSTLLLLLIVLLAPSAAGAAAPETGEDRLDVYTGVIAAAEVKKLVDLGIERRELQVEAVPQSAGKNPQVRVEVILSGSQAERLRNQGLDLSPKTAAAQRSAAAAAAGFDVFRRYGGPGGIKAELQQAAADNPDIAKLVNVGKSINGQDILALKVSLGARTRPDGSRPSVLYVGTQHAREWITPEMVRRLMHHVLDGYPNDTEIRRLVENNELWFLPVINPDGYDFTFEPGWRLWRKNLRDNDGNGEIDAKDGVDLNRNFAYKWGYDEEGSSSSPSSETYRGRAGNSEPETKAIDSLARRVRFKFLVNYHSAAELLLYGTAWQVATPTPDDVIYEAMAGDDAQPAIPGYDPDLSAELYTVNGDTDTHVTQRFGTLAFTPEMSTCDSAAESDPDDEWVPEECPSIFEFPDDEDLVQAEFTQNLPFALSVAGSAADPDDPVSVVGRQAEDFRIDSFDVSYGDPQTVAVIAKRAIKNLTMKYRIAGGGTKTLPAAEWGGGERYGNEGDDYYAEFRSLVLGAKAGQSVEVWFSGTKAGQGTVNSPHFTYTVASDTNDRVLVIANEDYLGVNPDYPPSVTSPKYAAQHLAAVEAAGYKADLWDVDSQGVPHPLGVLSHYDAVLWYLGDNRLTQDPEDLLVSSPFGNLPDMAVAERQQYLTMAIRDYLNEGGKLIHSSEMAQYQGLDFFSDIVGGVYYGLNGDPSAECVISSVTGLTQDCLILSDDFRQYYLGAFTRTEIAGRSLVNGLPGILNGYQGALGGPVVEGDNPLDEAGLFQPTSDLLPPNRFPQFSSKAAAVYDPPEDFRPFEGQRYAGVHHSDLAYSRLTTTIDLTGQSSAELSFQLSLDAEEGFDNLIVEAHAPGQDNWTTLPEAGGSSSTTPPAFCEDGSLLAIHPFLSHYLGGTDCTAPGTSGTWNALTGSTGGWIPVSFDLAPFLGGPVEVSISYVTDGVIGGFGAFVDSATIELPGGILVDGFEGPASLFTPTGPPPLSPIGTIPWVIGEAQFTAATSTSDTLLLGFGMEQLTTDAERVNLLKKALNRLI